MEIPGSKIRAYRERLQMTQRDFAESMGMSQALISLVELGRGPVSNRLLQRLRAKGDSGEFKPSFFNYLAEEGVGVAAGGSDSQVAGAIPLEPWAARVDLRKPADPDTDSQLYLPGLPAGSRAFRFNPAPRFLEPDTFAVFRLAEFSRLVRDQLVLVQFKQRASPRELPAGIAHLGRAIVTRRGRVIVYQFEAAEPNFQVAELDDRRLEKLMVCFARGRFCQ